MPTTTAPGAPPPGGQPFLTRDEHLLWLAGYDLEAQDFATEAEAIAAAEAVLALPIAAELGLTYRLQT